MKGRRGPKIKKDRTIIWPGEGDVAIVRSFKRVIQSCQFRATDARPRGGLIG